MRDTSFSVAGYALMVEDDLSQELCRSTSAKPADRRSPQQRTPQVHLVEVRGSSDTSNLYANS